ncbi:MAG: hypothetical protein ACJ77B_09655 [Chloroflexota bacterium]
MTQPRASRRAVARLIALIATATLLVGAAAAPVGAASPKSVAHSSAAKITKVGSGRLAKPVKSQPATDEADPETGPHESEELDAKISGSQSASRVPAAHVPAPAQQSVTGAAGAFGFDALSHRDQRFSGTGIYAGTNFSTEPPDQGLCVGNGFVFEGVNTAVAVYSPSGALLAGPTPLNELFRANPAIDRVAGVYGDDIGDVKCYYDPELQRFFVTSFRVPLDADTGGFSETESHVMLAVSSSNNPVTSTWTVWDLDTTDGNGALANHPNCPCFADQPLIGADHFGFYISTNEYSLVPFGTFFNGGQVYGFSKAALASGAGGTLSGVHLDNIPLAESTAYTLQPATSPAAGTELHELANGGTEYFLSALDFNAELDNRIAVWALTNTSTLGTTNAVTLQSRVLDSESYGQPPDAEQPNGPTPLRDALKTDPTISGVTSNEHLELLAGNDDRMNQTVYAAGSLWSNVNSVVKTANGNVQAGTAWFVVTPSWSGGTLGGTVTNQGYVSVNRQNVFYGSIAVNAAGRAAMGLTLVGPSYYPSTAWVSLSKTGPASNVHRTGIGAGPEDGFTGYVNPGFGGAGSARWGDYSAAVADEAGNLWLANEYITPRPRSLLANWGTFITRVTP